MATKRPPDRRATIIATAAELFAVKGYDAVGIDDIGAAVGISGPAIYKHFAGKDALLTEVMVSNTTRIGDALRVAREGGAVAEDVVRVGVAAMLEQPAALTTSVREYHHLVEQGRADEWIAAQRRVDAAWHQVLRELNPGLARVAETIRIAALLGPAIATATGAPDLPRASLEALVTATFLGILTSAQHDPVKSARPGSWRPPSDKRTAILRGALRLFRERGFAGVGVEDIGHAAGLSGPTLYHYFESKSALLVAAYERALQRILAGVDEAVHGANSADDALNRLARSYVSLALQDVDLIAVVEREVESLPDDERGRILDSIHRIYDTWASALSQLRPEFSAAEVSLLVSGVFPLVNQAVLAHGVRPDHRDDIVGVAVASLLPANKLTIT